MGADIHLYMEYKHKEYPEWQNFGGHFGFNRNYRLFGTLAGVRGDGEGCDYIDPRGMPKDQAYLTAVHNTCSMQDTEENRVIWAAWVEKGLSAYITNADGEQVGITHPDHHSHTWLTPDEFEAALKASETDHNGGNMEYHALLAAARCIELQWHEVRFVMWFDN